MEKMEPLSIAGRVYNGTAAVEKFGSSSKS